MSEPLAYLSYYYLMHQRLQRTD